MGILKTQLTSAMTTMLSRHTRKHPGKACSKSWRRWEYRPCSHTKEHKSLKPSALPRKSSIEPLPGRRVASKVQDLRYSQRKCNDVTQSVSLAGMRLPSLSCLTRVTFIGVLEATATCGIRRPWPTFNRLRGPTMKRLTGDLPTTSTKPILERRIFVVCCRSKRRRPSLFPSNKSSRRPRSSRALPRVQ